MAVGQPPWVGGQGSEPGLMIKILTFEMMTMKRRRVKIRLEMISHRGAGSLAKVEEKES